MVQNHFILALFFLHIWADDNSQGVPLPIQVNEALVEPNLVAMTGMVGMWVRTHASTLLDLQVMHYKSTEWLRWWQVTERNLWTMRRRKSVLLLPLRCETC